MTIDDNGSVDVAVSEQITLESVAAKLDAIGAQMDWLCENLAQLFGFVQQMGANGGGIRGMMKLLNQAPPEMTGAPNAG